MKGGSEWHQTMPSIDACLRQFPSLQALEQVQSLLMSLLTPIPIIRPI